VIIRDFFNGKKSFREFLESPEKISTSVLADRLQLLEGAGIAQHILSTNDKKVKWYYLTDRGIDLFPILYEMIYWSKRNLDQEFHPLSKEWFKKYESWTPEQTITENQKKYKEKREELLELQ
jgi:DNA-binding HxlR family transcriptional regulator